MDILFFYTKEFMSSIVYMFSITTSYLEKILKITWQLFYSFGMNHCNKAVPQTSWQRNSRLPSSRRPFFDASVFVEPCPLCVQWRGTWGWTMEHTPILQQLLRSVSPEKKTNKIHFLKHTWMLYMVLLTYVWWNTA